MDILRPELLWIGNCCYRLPNLKDGDHTRERQPQYAEEHVEDFGGMLCTDEPCDMEFDVEVLESGQYRLRLPISKVFWPKLVGAKGTARRRVEEETRTNLAIPRQTEDGDIVITGKSRRDVLLARSHVDASVHAARQRMKYTDFLSIPVQNQDIRASFLEFKTQVKDLCPLLPDKLFSPPEKLHLTLVVLLLVDNRERQQACDMFQQLSLVLKPKLAGKKLKIRIRGVDTMTDDASKTSVLYAKAENPLLQELANEAAAFFADSGFTKDRDIRPEVKLHVTLMNARFLEPDEDPAETRSWRGYQPRRPRADFDASLIIKEMKTFDFGEVDVKTIHLSQMSVYGEDGYYASTAVMQL